MRICKISKTLSFKEVTLAYLSDDGFSFYRSVEICGGKSEPRVMLPDLKKRMESSGVRIIILNENPLPMSHDGSINPRVYEILPAVLRLHGLLRAAFVAGESIGTV